MIMAFKSPVYNVISVPIEKIVPNTYNPNAVAQAVFRFHAHGYQDSPASLCNGEIRQQYTDILFLGIVAHNRHRIPILPDAVIKQLHFGRCNGIWIICIRHNLFNWVRKSHCIPDF